MWIKWIYNYYIKKNDIWVMFIFEQVVWVLRKIFVMRKYMCVINNWSDIVRNVMFFIKFVYYFLREVVKVFWKLLVCFKFYIFQSNFCYMDSIEWEIKD